MATRGATRLWPAHANPDFALAPGLPHQRESEFPVSAEAFNALKSKSGHAEPLREYAAVRTITMAMTPGREIQLSARLSF